MGRARAGSAQRHSTAEPIAGLSGSGRSEETLRPGDAGPPLESEASQPYSTTVSPGSPPRQRAHAACRAPRTPGVWLRAQPPAGLRVAAVSPASQPSPSLHRAPRTRCLDQKSVSAGADAPELRAMQNGRLRHGLQRNLLLLILTVSENSSSEQAMETGHGGLHYKDGGPSPSSGPLLKNTFPSGQLKCPARM